jgi:hypothetical protein
MAQTVEGILRLTIDGKKFAHETSASISLTLDFRERATKDTDGVERAPNIIDWSASGESLLVSTVDAPTEYVNFEDLFDAMLAKTEIDVEFTPSSTGNTFYSGKAYFSQLDASSAVNEDPTASFSLTGNGAPTKGVIAV